MCDGLRRANFGENVAVAKFTILRKDGPNCFNFHSDGKYPNEEGRLRQVLRSSVCDIKKVSCYVLDTHFQQAPASADRTAGRVSRVLSGSAKALTE
jgi:hypothetical protein